MCPSSLLRMNQGCALFTGSLHVNHICHSSCSVTIFKWLTRSVVSIRPDLVGSVLDPVSGLSLISLPSPGCMLDQTQANLTQRILDKLGEGLDVGVSGHVVYGQRHGEVKAFWSFSKFDQSRQPQEVAKLPQPLYLFKDFVKGG